MSLRVRRLSEEPGEPMPEEGHVGVNSVMAVLKREDLAAYSSRIMRIMPGGHTAIHEHPREHVAFVLSGTCRVESGEDVALITPGQIVAIPQGVSHRFVNAGTGRLALLVMNLYPEEHGRVRLLQEGRGQLLGWMDPDEARRWMAENKSRKLVDKMMPLSEAVERFTRDGDYFAMGGFGHVRFSMAGIYEMIRQGREGMTMAAKTAVHDIDVLIGGGVVSKVDCAYSFGHELRGLSPTGRRAAEGGKVEVVAEISNAGFQWRFKAASMGLPWFPARVMLGTDTLAYSSSRVMEDPMTGKPLCLLPACYPDFAFIHVHRCDRYGNAQIDGTIIEDRELAMAAKRLIITTEEIVPEDEIRAAPDRTVIPFYRVDAVCEVPYGSHPGNMPGLYYSDEEHMAEWLSLTRTEEGVQEYMGKYVHSVSDHSEYIELVGGEEKMEYLRKLEMLEVPMEAPWRK